MLGHSTNQIVVRAPGKEVLTHGMFGVGPPVERARGRQFAASRLPDPDVVAGADHADSVDGVLGRPYAQPAISTTCLWLHP